MGRLALFEQRAQSVRFGVCRPSLQGMALAESLARRVSQHGGAALIIDYGQAGSLRLIPPALPACAGSRNRSCNRCCCDKCASVVLSHATCQGVATSTEQPGARTLAAMPHASRTELSYKPAPLPAACVAGRALRGLPAGHSAARVCGPVGAAGQRRPQQPCRLLGTAVRGARAAAPNATSVRPRAYHWRKCCRDVPGARKTPDSRSEEGTVCGCSRSLHPCATGLGMAAAQR